MYWTCPATNQLLRGCPGPGNLFYEHAYNQKNSTKIRTKHKKKCADRPQSALSQASCCKNSKKILTRHLAPLCTKLVAVRRSVKSRFSCMKHLLLHHDQCCVLGDIRTTRSRTRSRSTTTISLLLLYFAGHTPSWASLPAILPFSIRKFNSRLKSPSLPLLSPFCTHRQLNPFYTTYLKLRSRLACFRHKRT